MLMKITNSYLLMMFVQHMVADIIVLQLNQLWLE